jgi:hypothetical protein
VIQIQVMEKTIQTITFWVKNELEKIESSARFCPNDTYNVTTHHEVPLYHPLELLRPNSHK